MRRIEKRKLDIEFLRVCIIYRIFPNFLKFKLYKKIRQPINQVTALKKKLLSIELKGQRRRLTSLEKEKEVLKTKLFSQIGILSANYAKKISFKSSSGRTRSMCQYSLTKIAEVRTGHKQVQIRSQNHS